MSTETKIITMKNIGTCTPYELRQELVRRGAMDIPEDQINPTSLLKRLVQELVKEEANKPVVVDENKKSKEEELRLLREKRKAEAIQRSLERQKDPNYFLNRKVAQEEIVKELEEKKKQEATTELKEEIIEEAESNTNEIDENDENYDPFKVNKFKSKIFIR